MEEKWLNGIFMTYTNGKDGMANGILKIIFIFSYSTDEVCMQIDSKIACDV